MAVLVPIQGTHLCAPSSSAHQVPYCRVARVGSAQPLDGTLYRVAGAGARYQEPTRLVLQARADPNLAEANAKRRKRGDCHSPNARFLLTQLGQPYLSCAKKRNSMALRPVVSARHWAPSHRAIEPPA